MEYKVVYGTGSLGVRPIETDGDTSVGELMDQSLTPPSKTAPTILYIVKSLDPTLPYYVLVGPKL
jgi:hypothetical protein